MDIIDIRQSDAWSTYLEMYGWKSLKLSNGTVLRVTSFILSNRAQLLRPNSLARDDLKEIDKLCRENKVFYIKISPSRNQNTEIFEPFGYKRTKYIDLPPKTMFIDLSKDTDDAWNNLTSGCRYSINKSRRDEDSVEFVQNPDINALKSFHRVLGKRSKKKNFAIPGLKDLAQVQKAFGDRLVIGNVYNKDGKILGAKMYLAYNKCVWGRFAATTALGQKSCGGYKLLWDSFDYFKRLGYTSMDLDGMSDDRVKRKSKRWAGYTFFKKRFNGSVVTFPLPYIKYFNPFWS